MSVNPLSINTIVKALVVVGCTTLVGGCGGGGGSGTEPVAPSDTSPEAPINNNPDTGTDSPLVIEGSANKGLIVNGIVQAYLIENQAGVMAISSTPYGTASRTDARGQFKLSLPANITSNSVVVDITADSKSTMTCDVAAGCKHDDTGTTTSFGEKFALNSEFSMKGVVTSPKKSLTNIIRITPMSHLALARSTHLQGGMTNANITQSYASVEQSLGLDAGALQLETPDLTNLAQYKNLSKAQLEVAILSASFLALTNSPDWNSIDEVLNYAADKMATSGALTETNLGALPDVALTDLYYEAGELAQDLAANSISTAQTGSLNKIYTEVQQAYQELSATQEVVDPVAITAQPSSATVNEHDAVAFTVSAIGGGELSYQWRKDGSAIIGANQASYSLADVALNAAGIYDVVVSNSVGSAVSMSALLTVKAVEIVTPTPEPTPEPTPTPVNSLPVALNDTATTPEDTSVKINVLANDSDLDGDTLSVAKVSANSGSVSINPDYTLTFVPAANFSGLTTISYAISDGKGGSAAAIVAVTVSATNDNPVAANDSAATLEDTPVNINVLANDTDADNDLLSVSLATATNGSVSIVSKNTVAFTPAANFNGVASVTYTVIDGQGGSAQANVMINVSAVNDVPVALDDAATIAEDTWTTLSVLNNDSDADGDTLSITLATANGGVVVINSSKTLTFTPSANFNGLASVTYTVSDGKGGSASATAKITVTAVNDQPISVNDSAVTDQNVAVIVNVLANDADVDGDQLSITSATSPNGSIVIGSQGTISFTPANNFAGSTTISYSVSDGKGGAATALVAVTVNPVSTVAKIELTWDIPLARENGDSLALYEINGYKIAYGTSPDKLTSTVFVSGGLIDSYVLENMTKGTYYIAIATVDSDDVQGAFSSTVTVNVM